MKLFDPIKSHNKGFYKCIYVKPWNCCLQAKKGMVNGNTFKPITNIWLVKESS